MDTAIVAVIGTLGGVLLGHGLQGKQLRQAAREKRRDDAAAILAPVSALMQDAYPDRLILWNVQQHREETVPKLLERWRLSKEDILRLSLGHPSSAVRELAEKLEVSFGNSLIRTIQLMDALSTDTSEKSDHDDALAHYRRSKEVFEELAQAIRER